MIGRRKFLQALGISPLAAKAVADEEIAKVTIRSWNAAPLAECADSVPGAPGVVGEASMANKASFLRMFGKLPDHVDRMTRMHAKRVTSLDPDIAARKSWSMAVKIQEQQQRNYDRQVESYRNAGWWETAQKTFSEKFGINWSY